MHVALLPSPFRGWEGQTPAREEAPGPSAQGKGQKGHCEAGRSSPHQRVKVSL